jgi:hypothetical protein
VVNQKCGNLQIIIIRVFLLTYGVNTNRASAQWLCSLVSYTITVTVTQELRSRSTLHNLAKLSHSPYWIRSLRKRGGLLITSNMVHCSVVFSANDSSRKVVILHFYAAAILSNIVVSKLPRFRTLKVLIRSCVNKANNVIILFDFSSHSASCSRRVV